MLCGVRVRRVCRVCVGAIGRGESSLTCGTACQGRVGGCGVCMCVQQGVGWGSHGLCAVDRDASSGCLRWGVVAGTAL